MPVAVTTSEIVAPMSPGVSVYVDVARADDRDALGRHGRAAPPLVGERGRRAAPGADASDSVWPACGVPLTVGAHVAPGRVTVEPELATAGVGAAMSPTRSRRARAVTATRERVADVVGHRACRSPRSRRRSARSRAGRVAALPLVGEDDAACRRAQAPGTPRASCRSAPCRRSSAAALGRGSAARIRRGSRRRDGSSPRKRSPSTCGVMPGTRAVARVLPERPAAAAPVRGRDERRARSSSSARSRAGCRRRRRSAVSPSEVFQKFGDA